MASGIGNSFLKIEKMASNHFSLEITSEMSWELFPSYAEKLLVSLSGTLLKKSTSVDMHIWDVIVNEASFQLVFDSFPLAVSLESNSDSSDKELLNIKNILEKCM